MKSISKKIIAIIGIIMILIVKTTVVNAADITSSLTSNSKLVEGGTVTVNINMSATVYGMSGTIAYDTDVFESAKVSSSVATSADLSNNVIVIESGSEMPAGTIGTITLKVKDSITKTEGKISISGIKVTDESITTQTTNNPSITIYADKDADGKDDDDGKTNTPATNTPAGTNTSSNSSTSGSKTTNTKNITTSKSTSSKLPKAGDQTTIAILSGIALLAIIGTVGFVKYKKQNDIK